MRLDSPNGNLGWKAPGFSLKDATGNKHNFETLKGEKGTLIAFICNHCPYVKAIISRLVADAKTLQSEGFGVVAIMSNDYEYVPADRPEKMHEFATENAFSFPYLIDEDQNVAKTYGAVCTPDFFCLNAKDELQYRGRLDDARMGDAQNRVPELLNAMRDIGQSGKTDVEQIPSMGCSIKWR